MRKIKPILLFVVFCFFMGCARQTLYVKPKYESTPTTPKIYKVNYEKGFFYALHSVELDPELKLNYFDKNAGIIEAQTENDEIFTVRVAVLDKFKIKVFTYVDADRFVANSDDRFEELILNYYELLNGHLDVFNES